MSFFIVVISTLTLFTNGFKEHTVENKAKLVNAMDAVLATKKAISDLYNAMDKAVVVQKQQVDEVLGACDARFGDITAMIVIDDVLWVYDGELGNLKCERWDGIVFDGVNVAVADDMDVVNGFIRLVEIKRHSASLEKQVTVAVKQLYVNEQHMVKTCHAVYGSKSRLLIYKGRQWKYAAGSATVKYKPWGGIIAVTDSEPEKKQTSGDVLREAVVAQ